MTRYWIAWCFLYAGLRALPPCAYTTELKRRVNDLKDDATLQAIARELSETERG